MEKSKSIIKITNMNKMLGNKSILDNFNLSVEENEMLAITGPSGSGKSTLLNIIGLIETFNNGDYFILNNKRNVTPNTRKANLIIRYNIGYIFQNFALVDNETVLYNLKIALRYVKGNNKYKNQLIEKALEKVNLYSKLHDKVYKLSGGEQQRVAVARNILKPSKLILADEPTGSLDNANKEIVISLIKELNRNGKTIIIATHDDDVINICNRKVILQVTRKSV